MTATSLGEPSPATATCVRLSCTTSSVQHRTSAAAAAGQAATRLTSLDLRGSAYAKVPAIALPRPAVSQEWFCHVLVPHPALIHMHLLPVQGGLPTSLRRAVNCRKLQLAVQSWDALTQV